MPTEEELTSIVRQARCLRCDGKGIRLVPAEDQLGERIPGKMDVVECGDCDGNGIKLAICRQLAASLQ